ncbi:uncharacterized protein BJ212DRAFT_1337486 [Suillus subaureus]|uniref:Uncharacterized protein n=1 Tax=Suillus subaureus TaxID=48587 RepID=A0A9P7EGG4_9AGAM|nr:uncharacterized protein BJ212DRAFT_1337486 [Suillus subaureus]KAG1821107.1 hypothetical protein BJ212DRAFT_1337486 [Suillus subaureus]
MLDSNAFDQVDGNSGLPISYGDVTTLQVAIHGTLATQMHRELYNTAHHTEETSTGNVSLPLVFV